MSLNLQSITSKVDDENRAIVIGKTVLDETDASECHFFDTADSTVIDQSEFQSCIEDNTMVHRTLAINGSETIDLTQSDSSIELNKSSNRQPSANTIDVNNKPVTNQAMATYRLVEFSSKLPAAETTLISLNSIQASNTCVRIENAGNELRNMHISNSEYTSD